MGGGHRRRSRRPGRAAVTVSFVAARALLLVVPRTLDGDDGVDCTIVSFLLAQNLKLQKEEEEKERRREPEEEADHEAHMLSSAERRWKWRVLGHPLQVDRTRKKRRKKKLPKVSSSSAPCTWKPGHCSLRPLRLWQSVPVSGRYMFMRQFSRLLVYAWVFHVLVDLGSEVDSPGNLDIISRALFWQLVVRCLSCLRSIGCVVLGDDHLKMVPIQFCRLDCRLPKTEFHTNST